MLEVKQYRKKWAIFSGRSRLSCLFPSEGLALEDMNRKRSLYEYWSGSASVSVENTDPVIKHI